MNSDAEIIIAGGGLNGLATGLALTAQGFSVAIVDPLAGRPTDYEKFDGRSYALSLTSQRLLQAIGVWDNVADQAQPILSIKVSDGRVGKGPSPFVMEFDHAEIEEGPMGFMVEDRILRQTFDQMSRETPGLTIIGGDSVDGIEREAGRILVRLASGATRQAAVLVGCDGRRSQVARMAGISRTGWEYGQTALVCSIEHVKPHNGTAHQYFMPPGPLAILPLLGNRSSIVWTESTERAAEIDAMSDAEYLQELRPRFGDFLGEINLAGARFSYPLGLSLANEFVAARLALVGDAAHRIHPIAGQGLNAGLKDVASLVEVLTLAARRGEDIGQLDVLKRYQEWRRFDVVTLALATDAFNRAFSNDNGALRTARDLGLAVVNQSSNLRRRFIREAAGLTGDVPKLMQGRPL